MALLRWQQTITDDQGNVIPGAEVEIRDESSGALLQLFSDREGVSPIGNPITAGPNGYAFAYLQPTRFRVAATDGVNAFSWRDIRLPEDAIAAASQAMSDHEADANPHAQYAQLSGGADANFAAMPQVGGDPIVESDSNSDGEWMRWADGSQLVYLRGIIPQAPLDQQPDGAGTALWTLPRGFIDAEYVPFVSCDQGVAGGARLVTYDGSSRAAGSFKISRYVADSGTLTNGPAQIGAWGRYK